MISHQTKPSMARLAKLNHMSGREEKKIIITTNATKKAINTEGSWV
jgi:hypothetical protein